MQFYPGGSYENHPVQDFTCCMYLYCHVYAVRPPLSDTLLRTSLRINCFLLRTLSITNTLYCRRLSDTGTSPLQTIYYGHLSFLDTSLLQTHSITDTHQRAEKVVSDSPGLVDFAIGLVNSVFNLPDGQVIFFEEFEKQKNCEINSAVQKAFGLVEMTSGLVNVSFSLPVWQTVKVIFFATCSSSMVFITDIFYYGHLSCVKTSLLRTLLWKPLYYGHLSTASTHQLQTSLIWTCLYYRHLSISTANTH